MGTSISVPGIGKAAMSRTTSEDGSDDIDLHAADTALSVLAVFKQPSRDRQSSSTRAYICGNAEATAIVCDAEVDDIRHFLSSNEVKLTREVTAVMKCAASKVQLASVKLRSSLDCISRLRNVAVGSDISARFKFCRLYGTSRLSTICWTPGSWMPARERCRDRLVWAPD